MCDFEFIAEEGEVCGIPSVLYHNKSPNYLGKLIWGGDIGNSRKKLLAGRKEVHRNGVSYTRDIVWEVYEGAEVEYGGYKRQELWVTLNVIKAPLARWEEEWEGEDPPKKIRISYVMAEVVIGLCGGLRGEEVFFSSLKGMLKFWEETRLRKQQPYSMVTLQG